ncbi:hypothetical protein RQP46_000593 [Phenoliferia psychrophenolica]
MSDLTDTNELDEYECGSDGELIRVNASGEPGRRQPTAPAEETKSEDLATTDLPFIKQGRGKRTSTASASAPPGGGKTRQRRTRATRTSPEAEDGQLADDDTEEDERPLRKRLATPSAKRATRSQGALPEVGPSRQQSTESLEVSSTPMSLHCSSDFASSHLERTERVRLLDAGGRLAKFHSRFSRNDKGKGREDEAIKEDDEATEDEAQKPWCTCHTPYNAEDERSMILCDRCNVWYHFDCVKLSEESTGRIDKYFCPACEGDTPSRTTWHAAAAPDSESSSSSSAPLMRRLGRSKRLRASSSDTPVIGTVLEAPVAEESVRRPAQKRPRAASAKVISYHETSASSSSSTYELRAAPRKTVPHDPYVESERRPRVQKATTTSGFRANDATLASMHSVAGPALSEGLSGGYSPAGFAAGSSTFAPQLLPSFPRASSATGNLANPESKPPSKIKIPRLPKLPKLPKEPKPPKVKVPRAPKPPKVARAAKRVQNRPEFTISKDSWVVPERLAMIPISPAIVIRPDAVGDRPAKNPHGVRFGVEPVVEEKRPGNADEILKKAVGPQRSKGKAAKNVKIEPAPSPSLSHEIEPVEVEVPPVEEILIDELPPIWCLGRQELCEALPYFKSYQGGHYDKDERCIGYLLDGYPSAQDCCADGGRVIISHDRDNLRVRALINCHKTHSPVVLIAGSSYDFFPWLAPRKIRYAVLGYYFVDKYWVEAEPRASAPGEHFNRFKWAPSQGEPWFSKVIGGKTPSSAPGPISAPLSIRHLLTDGAASAESLMPSFLEPSSSSALHETTCDECHQVATAVYEEDIGCYNERCSSFFKITGRSTVANPKDLKIREPFLRAIDNPSWPSTVPMALIPKSMDDIRAASVNFSQAGWRAFHCDQCGRLSSRSQWHQVECECCLTTVPVTYNTYTAAEASSAVVGAPIKPGKMAPGIIKTPIDLDGFSGWTYELGLDGAKVHHLRPTNAENLADSDRFFDDFQAPPAAQLFRRNALSMHKIPGEYLCSQFSFNTGAEYKHVVRVPTYSFDESPKVVADARTYLENVSRAIISEATPVAAVEFNEVLSVAYMEGAKMNFHDDGERGLDPVVSTLSLGGEATMSFRLKEKKKAKQPVAAPVAPALASGSAPSGSSTITSDSAPGSLTSGVFSDQVPQPNLTPAPAPPPPATAPSETSTPKRGPRTLLTLSLRHADITVMEGESVQKWYEHAITTKDGLRFGLPVPRCSSTWTSSIINHILLACADPPTRLAFSYVNKDTLAVATSQFRARLSPLDIVLDVRNPGRAWLRKEYVQLAANGQRRVKSKWEEATEEQMDWICWREKEIHVLAFEEWPKPIYISKDDWAKGLPGYDGYRGVVLASGAASLVAAEGMSDSCFGHAIRETWRHDPSGPCSDGLRVRDFAALYTGRYEIEAPSPSRLKRFLSRIKGKLGLRAGTRVRPSVVRIPVLQVLSVTTPGDDELA